MLSPTMNTGSASPKRRRRKTAASIASRIMRVLPRQVPRVAVAPKPRWSMASAVRPRAANCGPDFVEGAGIVGGAVQQQDEGARALRRPQPVGHVGAVGSGEGAGQQRRRGGEAGERPPRVIGAGGLLLDREGEAQPVGVAHGALPAYPPRHGQPGDQEHQEDHHEHEEQDFRDGEGRPAMPPKPSTPAMRPITRKSSAQRNMENTPALSGC